MINLLKINMKREYWELINNKTRLVISLFFNAIVLYIVYNKFINTEDGYIQIVLIVGSLLIILSSFVVMSEKLIKEFENGTIFSLIITPYTLSSILLSEILTENILNTVKLIVLLILSFVIVENSYSINYIYYMMFLFIGNLGLYGIGLIIASISLISREFKLVANIFRVIFIYLIFNFRENIFIPFSYTKKILVDLILYENFSFSYYPINFFIKLFLNSIGYFILGFLIFKVVEYKITNNKFINESSNKEGLNEYK